MQFKSRKSRSASMRNIKIVLEYDGTNFAGFQRQPARPTIQQVVEESLSKLLNAKTKIKSASGRTDSGVHATHQVINFHTRSKIDLVQIQRGMNRYLPSSVAVIEAKEAADLFHARFSAKTKTYEYRIWNHPSRAPLKSAHTCHIPQKLNVTRMRKAARLFLGRHDFKSFTASASGNLKDTVRKVNRCEIRKQGSLLIFTVEGNGFLQHMVRNLVGTLMEVGRGKKDPEEIKAILRAKDRRKAGPTAPANGLCLVNVTY